MKRKEIYTVEDLLLGKCWRSFFSITLGPLNLFSASSFSLLPQLIFPSTILFFSSRTLRNQRCPPLQIQPLSSKISHVSLNSLLSLFDSLSIFSEKKTLGPPPKNTFFFSSLSYLSPCYNPQKCLSCHVAPFSVQFCLLSSNGCVSPF